MLSRFSISSVARSSRLSQQEIRHRFLPRTPASLLPLFRGRSRPSRAVAAMVTLVVATTADPASVGPASAFLAMPGWNPGPSIAVSSPPTDRPFLCLHLVLFDSCMLGVS
ncbi:hypothetical protein B296_00022610 [Ensete ventricosum]|uniref:Uncharacterized protein n=1 Tax=Ensete ventricosum TaxID=4639 RepID=A0A426YK05_ENSVE|nr:hypothetical protein B296_00022610 [Ensete ventricosum]